VHQNPKNKNDSLGMIVALFTMADKEEEEGPWRNSATRHLLIKDMKDGLIPLEGGKMPPRVTWMQQPEYTIIPLSATWPLAAHHNCQEQKSCHRNASPCAQSSNLSKASIFPSIAAMGRI
jgi:hypothetical protein